MNIYEQIKTILIDNYGVDEDAISPRATFDSLQLDSLDTIEIITDLEDEFEVELDDLEELSDLESLCDKIEELQEEA